MRKFDRSFNGYDVKQVNAFVDDTIKEVDDMITKMKQKDLEIERLNSELTHFKEMSSTLNRAVVVAEEAANRIQVSSLSESDKIITEAKRNANRIINDALYKAEQYEQEALRARRNIIVYKRRLKQIVEEQSSLIDDIDKIDLDN